jgi:Immunoglobulin V-set domain
MLSYLFLLTQNIMALTNDNIVLPCNSTNVTWVYYRKFPIHEQIIYDMYDPRITTGHSALTIRNFEYDDQGDYMCVKNDIMIRRYTIIPKDTPQQETLRVKNHRYVLNNITETRVSVNEGDSVNFTCTNSNAKSNYYYIFLNHFKTVSPVNNVADQILKSETASQYYMVATNRISMTQRNSTFTITIDNITRCDAGLYECSIYTGDPSSDIYQLSVVKLPSLLKMKHNVAPLTAGGSSASASTQAADELIEAEPEVMLR